MRHTKNARSRPNRSEAEESPRESAARCDARARWPNGSLAEASSIDSSEFRVFFFSTCLGEAAQYDMTNARDPHDPRQCLRSIRQLSVSLTGRPNQYGGIHHVRLAAGLIPRIEAKTNHCGRNAHQERRAVRGPDDSARRYPGKGAPAKGSSAAPQTKRERSRNA